MKIKIAILVLLFPIFSFAQKKECDCWKIYTGTFYSAQENGDTIFYERTKEKQVEYLGSKPRNKFKLNIIWLNECKYILRYPKENNSMKNKVMKGDVVSKIIQTGKDFFIVKSKEKGKKQLTLTIYTYPPGAEI